MSNLFNHTQSGPIGSISIPFECPKKAALHTEMRERAERHRKRHSSLHLLERYLTWFPSSMPGIDRTKKGNTRSISLFSLDQITALGVPCHSVTGSIWRMELTSQEVLRFKENMKSLYFMEQNKAGAGSMPCSNEVENSNYKFNLSAMAKTLPNHYPPLPTKPTLIHHLPPTTVERPDQHAHTLSQSSAATLSSSQTPNHPAIFARKSASFFFC